VAPGDIVVASDSSAVEGRDTWVQLPGGRLDVTVSDPRRELAAAETADSETPEAADGNSFVGITWTFDDGASVPFWQRPLVTVDEEAPTVTLVADDRTYEVGSPLPSDDPDVNTEEAFFVTVEGSPGDLALQVTLDGLTQEVDLATGERDAGAAEPLYAEPGSRPSEVDCSGLRAAEGVQLDLTCGATVQLLPYVAGAGWAPAGQQWAAVRLETEVSAISAGGARYRVTGEADATRLDGADPERDLPQPPNAAEPDTWLVFPSATDAPLVLDVVKTFTAEKAGGAESAPDRRSFRVTGEFLLAS
jgi:hypothetical protein